MLICRSEGGLPQDMRKKIALFASLPVGGGRLGAATSTTSTRSRSTTAPRASTTSSSSTSGSRRRTPELGGWERWCAGRARRRRRQRRCGSRSSASTSSSRTPTCRSSRRCATRASSTAAGSRSTGWTPRRCDDGEVRARLAGADGILDPRRLRRARDRGQDHARRGSPASSGSRSSGICLGMQMAVCRVRPPRRRHGRRELDGVRPRDAVPGHRPPARAEGGRRHGRHDAPGRRPDQAARRTRGRARSTARPSSTSATATATRSTTSCASGWRPPACVCSGTSPDERLVEVIEIPDHPFFVASQYHPEFKSRPERPGAAVPRVRRRGRCERADERGRGARRGRARRASRPAASREPPAARGVARRSAAG